MNKVLTFFSLCVSHIVYRLSFLVPRSNKVWVCIGWHTNKEREIFADNSKYFFLHLSNNALNIRPIWLSRDKKLAELLISHGYEAYSIHSLKGIWFAIRAGHTIIDAFLEMHFWRYTGGSKIIQLWHGKGMKKTGYDSQYSLKSRSKFLQAGMFSSSDKLIASSQYTADLMSTTFNEPNEKILVKGLPRNDVLKREIEGSEIDSHSDLQEMVETVKITGIKKIFLYAPTFRPGGDNPVDSLEFSALQQILHQNRYHLIISLHPKFGRKDYYKTVSFSNITYIDSGYDIYPQLNLIDVLITDYSSLYVDFLLLDRPIIFYTYDIDDYRLSMGLHDDFKELTPGPHPLNSAGLIQAIISEDTYTKDRSRVLKILFEETASNASQKILDTLSR